MTVTARGPGGMPSRQTSSFTTLSPDSLTTVNLNTIAGFPLVEGNSYGVGTVVWRTSTIRSPTRSPPRSICTSKPTCP